MDWLKALAAGAGSPADMAFRTGASPEAVERAPAVRRRNAAEGGGRKGFDSIIRDVANRTAAMHQYIGQTGAALSQPITPQDRVMAFVDQVMRGPVSLNQATKAVGLLPAPEKKFGAKDQIVAEAASLLEQKYKADLAAIDADPDATPAEKRERKNQTSLDRIKAVIDLSKPSSQPGPEEYIEAMRRAKED